MKCCQTGENTLTMIKIRFYIVTFLNLGYQTMIFELFNGISGYIILSSFSFLFLFFLSRYSKVPFFGACTFTEKNAF